MNRQELIDGLRAVADLYEKHPRLPLPLYLHINVMADTRKEAADAMRTLGSVTKDYFTNTVILSHEINASVRFNVIVYRDQVCRQIVTKKLVAAQPEKIIPAQPEHEVEEIAWECDEPILAPEMANQ